MTSLRLFHATTEAAAVGILKSGFRDRTQRIDRLELIGVWLSDVPLDQNEGAKGTVLLACLLAISLPLESLAQCELIEEGKPYREFCMPSGTVNRYPVVRLSAEDARKAAAARWARKASN